MTIEYFVEQLRRIEVDRCEDHWELMAILNLIAESRSETIENLKQNCKVRELKVNSTNQKIALWCELYKQRYGYNYQVSTAEASAIKNVDVTVELINLFFQLNEWWSKEKTISRYAKNINEIKRIFTGKKKAGRNSQAEGGEQTDIGDLASELQRRYGNK